MWMTDEQIRFSYREAAFPKDQIKILSQLNACGQDDIRKIIADIKINKPTGLKEAKYDRWTDEQAITLDRLYKDGIKPQTISRIIGVSVRRIYSKLDRIKKEEAKKKAASGARTPATATR